MTTSEHSAEHAGSNHHIDPLWLYLAVFGALIFMTVVTVGASYFDFGAANTAIAVLIATVKASLVAVFFMHLRHDKPFHSLVLMSGLLFLSFLFIFSMADIDTRSDVDATHDELITPFATVAPAASAAPAPAHHLARLKDAGRAGLASQAPPARFVFVSAAPVRGILSQPRLSLTGDRASRTRPRPSLRHTARSDTPSALPYGARRCGSSSQGTSRGTPAARRRWRGACERRG